MTIVQTELHRVAAGVEADTLFLAHDTLRSNDYVEHQWARRTGGRYEAGVDEIPIEEFLESDGAGQTSLRRLLGR